MAVNITLLRKAVEWVEEQDRLSEGRVWDQLVWCGSTMCIAGKVATDAGWRPIGGNSVKVLKGGDEAWVDQVAAALLGLTDDQATELFESDNSARQIRWIAEHIAGERL